jgi:hypothetical protein
LKNGDGSQCESESKRELFIPGGKEPMNGIRDRIDDALLLWENGRHEGALLCALVALAATARKRYPKLGDREGFERFFSEARRVVIGVEYRGECHCIEHVLYKWLRCQLVHEAGLPLDLKLMEEDEPNTMSVRAGGAPEYVLKIGHGWFGEIVRSVVNAPENKNCTFKRGLRAGERASNSKTDRRKAAELQKHDKKLGREAVNLTAGGKPPCQ